MGCSCVRENDEQLAPAKHKKARQSHHTRKHLPASQDTEATERISIFGWKQVRTINGPITDLYRIEETLREDKKSKLSAALHLATNQRFFVEEFPKETNAEDHGPTGLPKEVELVRSLDHPNIITAFDFLEGELAHYAVYETYACTLADTTENFGPRAVDNVGKVMVQVMRALQYTHQLGLVHKNLNLSTIALKNSDTTQPFAKILRFGAPPQTFDRKALKKSPYCHYIAPEVFHDEECEKSDIWSCGVIMHVLINGMDVVRKVHTQHLDFPKHKWQGMRAGVQELVAKMLSLNPKLRPTAEEFLCHPWVAALCPEMSCRARPVREALTNLCSQQPRHPLRDAIKSFILTRLYPQSELVSMADTFRATDTDKDGRITRDNLEEVLRKVMPTRQAEQSVDEIMSRIDLDGNGYITYSEFLHSAICESEILSQENVAKLFNVLDKDSSGRVSVEELREAFYINGPEDLIEDMWKKLLKEIDKSGNGEVDYGEFEILCSKAFTL